MTYGWWRSFEHYCVPDSSPVAISNDINRIEADIRRQVDAYVKLPVVAEDRGAGWRICRKVKSDALVALTTPQARKYDAARRGESRGNLGPIPPATETAIVSIDLDGR